MEVPHGVAQERCRNYYNLWQRLTQENALVVSFCRQHRSSVREKLFPPLGVLSWAQKYLEAQARICLACGPSRSRRLHAVFDHARRRANFRPGWRIRKPAEENDPRDSSEQRNA